MLDFERRGEQVIGRVGSRPEAIRLRILAPKHGQSLAYFMGGWDPHSMSVDGEDNEKIGDVGQMFRLWW